MEVVTELYEVHIASGCIFLISIAIGTDRKSQTLADVHFDRAGSGSCAVR